jgi:hypothetical protein
MTPISSGSTNLDLPKELASNGGILGLAGLQVKANNKK